MLRTSDQIEQAFGDPETDVRHAKAAMAAQIAKVLDQQGLSTRQAQEKTGISHSDFSRIRCSNFGRFTIDRLITILTLLGQEVEVSISVHPRGQENLPTNTVNL